MHQRNEELLQEIRDIRAEARAAGKRAPGKDAIWRDFYPEMDRRYVQWHVTIVTDEEAAAKRVAQAASAPEAALAVPAGADVLPLFPDAEPVSDVESPFSYAGRPIRVVELNGEPWFVAADVCAVLDIGNVSMALERLAEADISLTEVWSATNNRAYPYKIISEGGLYELIIRSDKPEARPFRRWVTSEVLPSIRKTGAYVSPTITPTQLDQLSEELEARKAVALLSVLTAARELVGDDWTQARARSLVAGVVGGEAEIDMERRPLMVDTYLKSKGLRGDVLKKHRGPFGKVVKALYMMKYGEEPHTRETDVDGHWIPVCAYSERDRPLMDQAWRQYGLSFRAQADGS